MTDKEVGELWRSLHSPDWVSWWLAGDIRDAAINLIRKLVEERAMRHIQAGIESGYQPPRSWEALALRDFGIDPKDWPL